MRTRLIIIFILIFEVSSHQSDAQTLGIGDNLISGGYGFPYLPAITFADYLDEPGFNVKTSGPYYFKFEHIFSDEVTVGLNFAYASNKGKYFEKYDQYNPITGLTESISYLHKIDRVTYSVLFRANWYIVKDRNFYAYFGVGMGYRSERWKITSTNPRYVNEEYPNNLPFGFEATLGAKYLLSDLISAYGEVGLAKSPIQLGLCIALGSTQTDPREKP